MPAGPLMEEQPISLEYRSKGFHDLTDLHGRSGPESAASILQSVKEQEAQFEQLTRELEAERHSVANQLERCKNPSETASMSSISSTDESFHWRPPAPDARFDEESDADSKVSGSHLLDSCLRVLQERDLHINDNPQTYYTEDPYSHQTDQQTRTVTTVTKVVTSHQVLDADRSGSQSGLYPEHDQQRPPLNSYSDYTYPTGGLHSPAGSHRDAHPPATRDDRYGGYPDEPNGSLGEYPPEGASHSRLPDDRGTHPGYGSPHDSYDRAPLDSYPTSLGPAAQPLGGYARPEDEDPYNYPRGGGGVPYDGDRDRDRDRERDREPPYVQYPDSREYLPPLGSDQPSPRPPSEHLSDRTPSDRGGPPPSRSPHGSLSNVDGRYPPGGPLGGARPLDSPHSDRYSDRPSEGRGSQRLGEPPYRGAAPVPLLPPPTTAAPPTNAANPYTDSHPRGGADPYHPSREEDPYQRGPPSQADREDPYGSRPRVDDRFPPLDMDRARTPSPVGSLEPGYRPFDPHGNLGNLDPHGGRGESPAPPHIDLPPEYPEEGARNEAPPRLGAPPFLFDPDFGRRSPSINSFNKDQRWRNPDLPEVIEFLSHPNEAIKANAAGYLQHLCYLDDDTKAKTRSLGGIPPLVELVNHEVPEVHRAACGVLRNLSYGRVNDENKRSIKNAGGIPSLIRLLRKSNDNDVRELVTGILWNLSSSKDLKRPIIDDGLTVIVSNVIVPHSGWDPNRPNSEPRDVYWSTVFRNASGVLRNVSSDGPYSRKKLRECDGLCDSIVHIVQAAIGKSDIDNKSVENCVCVLRNLSYACQEVEDPSYIQKRAQAKPSSGKGADSTGCFGGSSGKKKKDSKDAKNKQGQNASHPAVPEFPKGMEILWHPKIVHLYLPLLYDCTNPETLEASAGAIQNLAACDWQPSVDIRATVRKEKGLPVLVELLNLEADRVVCAAATALRNLALDPLSKELIGKYAMRQLVTRLPDRPGRPQASPVSDETICALEALIYEVIKTSLEFAQAFLQEGGVDRLMFIVREEKFTFKVRKYASSILAKMWEFKELKNEYKSRNLSEAHFLVKPLDPSRKGSPLKSAPSSAENTLNRPRMDQSGPTVAGYNEHTLPYINREATRQPHDYMEQDPKRPNGKDGYRGEDIPMTRLGPPAGPDPHGSPGGYYDSIDRRGGAEANHLAAPHGGAGGYTNRAAPQAAALGADFDRGSDYNRSLGNGNDFDRGSDYLRGPAGAGAGPGAGMVEYDRHSDRPSDHHSDRHSTSDYNRPLDYGRGPLDTSREGSGTFHDPPRAPYDDYPEERQDSFPPHPQVDFRPAYPMGPGSVGGGSDRHTPQPVDDRLREPLYARVSKDTNQTGGVVLDNPQTPPGGADSWV